MCISCTTCHTRHVDMSCCAWHVYGMYRYDVFKEALHITANDLTLVYDALGASAAFAALAPPPPGL